MAYTTDTTIVAAFKNSSDAQAAAADLQAAGISRSDIYLESSSAPTPTDASSSYASRTANHEGGVVGWFKSLFNDEEATTQGAGYQSTIDQGGYLLSVDTSEAHLDSVEAILNRHNPVTVHSDDKSTYGTATPAVGYTAATTATTTTPATAKTGTDSIEVLKEDLQVGKRSVLRGGVRVFSRVVETPVEESIGLREEHVRVNRTAVNRPATEADFTSGRNQSIEVQEFAEEAVVAKQARVVEEIQVGKEVSERTETIKDSVRHTEVEVEELPGTTTTTGLKSQIKTTGK